MYTCVCVCVCVHVHVCVCVCATYNMLLEFFCHIPLDSHMEVYSSVGALGVLWVILHIYRSLLQKRPIKETIFFGVCLGCVMSDSVGFAHGGFDLRVYMSARVYV